MDSNAGADYRPALERKASSTEAPSSGRSFVILLMSNFCPSFNDECVSELDFIHFCKNRRPAGHFIFRSNSLTSSPLEHNGNYKQLVSQELIRFFEMVSLNLNRYLKTFL